MSADKQKSGLSGLLLAPLGIVFGDLGTSPLYTMQTIFEAAGGGVSTEQVLGVLSLIIWSLLLVVSVKYGIFVMMADNSGEGGILALTSLVTNRRDDGRQDGGQREDDGHRRRIGRSAILLGCGLFGGALLYGDGILTPAISVLSAIEGVKVATPALDHLIMPIATAILIGLFCLQTFGTQRIGRLFGPVMLLWFVTIGGLGAWSLRHHPEVLLAVDPRHGMRYLAAHGWGSLAVLGGVFLSLTGAEALYADMGHVGRRSIRLSWYAVVLPALLLCYAGQSAMLIGRSKLPDNPFYGIIPPEIASWAIWPMVILATAATIIASQAIITGAFSMTRQAIQLGWFPGLNIRQTSDEEYGQIYVPAVNWTMMVFTVAITVAFGSSSRLAGAYGMAVSTTMLLTTVLLYSYLHHRAHWSAPAAALVALVFLAVDLAFFAANLTKFLEGGFVPLLAGLVMFLIMTTWIRGIGALRAVSSEHVLAPELFLRQLAEGRVPRVPGTAVFLTRINQPISPAMVSHVEEFGALQQAVVTLTVEFQERPRVPAAERLAMKAFEGGLWHATVRYGFVEIPSLPAALALTREHGCPVVPSDALFISRRDEVVRAHDGEPHRLAGWRRVLFGFMFRNAVHFADRFDLPGDRFVQIGRQIAL